MKKTLLLLMIILSANVGRLYAQDALVVNMNDGTSYSFNIQSIGKIDLGESNFTIISKQQSSFDYTKVKSMKFANLPTSINASSSTGALTAKVVGDAILLSGLDHGKQNLADIYSISGQKITSSSKLNSSSIDISSLSKGVYVLKINNQSFKFTR